MQLLGDLGADLCGITVDGLTATENNVLGADADLVDGSGQDLGGSEGIGTAELAAGDQHAAVSAAGHQLTQHTLCRRRAHGDDDDLAAGLVLQLQGGLDGVQVVGVGDGSHGRAIHGAVSLDSDLALRIGNLFDTNDCFHYVCPPYFSSAPPMTIIWTSLVPS